MSGFRMKGLGRVKALIAIPAASMAQAHRAFNLPVLWRQGVGILHLALYDLVPAVRLSVLRHMRQKRASLIDFY